MANLREVIDQSAKALNILNKIQNLSDRNAIKEIQIEEGNQSCYGNDEPLIGQRSNPKLCSISDCKWRTYCNWYRTSKILPLDKELHFLTKTDLETITQELLKIPSLDKDTNLSAVGLRTSSITEVGNPTKKMLIASPKTIIEENQEASKIYLIAFNKSATQSSGEHYGRSSYSVLWTSNILGLKKFLTETDEFLKSKNLIYSPLLKMGTYFEEYGRRRTVHDKSFHPGLVPPFSNEEMPHTMFDFDTILKVTPHLALEDPTILVSDPEFIPLLNMEIPYIENTSFNTLKKVMDDYPEELCSFRDFLQPELEKLRDSVLGSANFQSSLLSAERELRENLRKLDSDFKKLKSKTIFNSSGAIVALFTLGFYCIFKEGGDILKILGPGGIAYKLSETYSEFLQKKIDLKENSAYFIWKLGKTKSY